ncbi:hypothetical protein L3Y34_012951 [Caenorhabditis briggsae]|uniref:Uncharacterized protein n=1 Tax=Caenorhabditis briggsae TaxID=6238 RepID=A0AAE9CWH1_CAEBR|nr:hypothetical protein L3Y34_012951 [Caenorhabditis briggsae]
MEIRIIPVMKSPPSPISKCSAKFSIPSSVTTTLDHKQSSTILILHDPSVNRHDNRHDTRDGVSSGRVSLFDGSTGTSLSEAELQVSPHLGLVSALFVEIIGESDVEIDVATFVASGSLIVENLNSWNSVCGPAWS